MNTTTADATEYATNGNGGPWAVFGKYGLPGLVILVLFYFTWHNMSATAQVIQKNTEVMVEMRGAVQGMKDALKDNTNAVQQMREDRRTVRTR